MDELFQAGPESTLPGLHSVLHCRDGLGQLLLLPAPALAGEIVSVGQMQRVQRIGVGPWQTGQHPSTDLVAVGVLAVVGAQIGYPLTVDQKDRRPALDAVTGQGQPAEAGRLHYHADGLARVRFPSGAAQQSVELERVGAEAEGWSKGLAILIHADSLMLPRNGQINSDGAHLHLLEVASSDG